MLLFFYSGRLLVGRKHDRRQDGARPAGQPEAARPLSAYLRPLDIHARVL